MSSVLVFRPLFPARELVIVRVLIVGLWFNSGSPWETMPSSDFAASRRKFLQAALTTGSAAALLPAFGAGRATAPTNDLPTPQVKAVRTGGDHDP